VSHPWSDPGRGGRRRRPRHRGRDHLGRLRPVSPGQHRLILGHESLGRVLDPGLGTGLQTGDLIVGIVRRPDPVPCGDCAVGEWDMCRNGQYTERGIKEIDGFMSERWRIDPGYFTKFDPPLGILGMILEPTTVVSVPLRLHAM
jgi:threonine dehydrogenase-like Zn-dependent dehydrogenase